MECKWKKEKRDKWKNRRTVRALLVGIFFFTVILFIYRNTPDGSITEYINHLNKNKPVSVAIIDTGLFIKSKWILTFQIHTTQKFLRKIWTRQTPFQE